MDRGAWWATAHGVAKSRTRLSEFSSLLFFTLRIESKKNQAQLKELNMRAHMHSMYTHMIQNQNVSKSKKSFAC